MAEKRKSKAKPNVEVVRVGSNNYVLFRPSDVYSGLRDKQALHIGNLDHNKVFHPTSAYFELTKDYLEAIVFPSDWSLKNIPASNLSVSIKSTDKVKTSLAPKPKKEKEEPSPELKTLASQISATIINKLCFGASWLLYQTALKLGIIEDLLNVFGGDREKVNRIFSLVTFAMTSYDDFDQVEDWQCYNFLLTRAELDYDRIIRILSSVSEDDCEEFMRLRREHLPKEKQGYLCVQTSKYISDGEYTEDYSQEVVFYAYPISEGAFLNGYSYNEKTPFYYAEIPSNIRNKKINSRDLLKVIEKVLPNGEQADLCVVTDCGEDSITDLDPILRKGLKVQTKADPRQSDIKRIIREEFNQGEPQSSSKTPSLFDTSDDEYSFQETTRYKLSGKLIGSQQENTKNKVQNVEARTTVMLNSSTQEDYINFISDEIQQESERAQKAIDEKSPITDRELFESEFRHLKFSYDDETGTVLDFFHNHEEIDQEILIAGFEAFRTFGIDISKDQVSFLDAEYTFQEYNISNLKGQLGQNRFVGQEKEAQQGKRLVTFISIILNLYLENKIDDEAIFKLGVEPRDMLNNLNGVYAFQRGTRTCLGGKNLTRFVKIIESLGAEIPKGIQLIPDVK